MSSELEDITVVMVARNAGSTIARAVRSAARAGARNILLVDDASEDDTITRAQAAADGSLTVIRNEKPVSLGYVRSLAVQQIKTPYAAWLDADDEMTEGYLEAMRAPLVDGSADLVFSDCVLVDGRSGDVLKHLDVPEFMKQEGAHWRSFERNWYPSLLAAFRTDFVKDIDYDHAFACSEDYDFLLRALMAGARVRVAEGCTYRYYHYDTSVSRNRGRTAEFTAAALLKHRNKDIELALDQAGFPVADRASILMSKAMFEGDVRAVFEQAGRAKDTGFVVPSNGLAAEDVARFYEGTAALLTGDAAWAALVLAPLGELGAPDACNNLAVALLHTADEDGARAQLEKALESRPDYFDARQNLIALETGEPLGHITRHPLRRAASRDAYGG